MSKSFLPTEIIRLYRIWTSILYRCTRKENKQYKNYGGRGITICDEWMDFNKFVEDVYDEESKGFHLDRADNNKGYFKENCRWVTPKVNHRNKRNNRVYKTHIGDICESELIEKMGYTRSQFRRAIQKYDADKIIEMFKTDTLPKKRGKTDPYDLIGKKRGSYTVISLDEESKALAYFCVCDCGKQTRASRFKLIHELCKNCPSCCRIGDKNPKNKKYNTFFE